MTVSERFAKLIEVLNFTPNSLSKELGVTQPTIKKLETGTTLPNGKVLIPLLESFNVNINWLLGGKGEMFINSESSYNQKIINGNNNQAQIGDNTKSNINSNNSNATDITSLKKEIEGLKKEIKSQDKVIKSQEAQLKDKERLIAMLEKNQK